MDFELTEAQLAAREVARDFAEKEIKPVVAELDRRDDMDKKFPWDIVKKGSQIGLRTMGLPEKYGGQGEDYLTQILVAEELAFVDINFGKIFSHQWSLSDLILHAGTEEQRQRILPAFLKDDSFLFSIAMTDPDHGSDNILPFDDPKGGLNLSAVRNGDHYVLNGVKEYSSLGHVASLVIVFGRTDPTVGILRGATAFLVPKDTPGFKVGKVHNLIAWRTYVPAELFFEDVRVPKENVLGGKEGQGHLTQDFVGRNDLDTGAMVVGLSRHAYDAALSFAKQRVQGGKPIIQHQSIAMYLAEMYTDIQVLDTMVWRAAWLATNGRNDPKLCLTCRLLARDIANRVTDKAMEIHGGVGADREAPIEKLRRDALAYLHAGGSPRLDRIKLGTALAR